MVPPAWDMLGELLSTYQARTDVLRTDVGCSTRKRERVWGESVSPLGWGTCPTTCDPLEGIAGRFSKKTLF